MRVHVLSDLHLEFGGFEPSSVDADLIVLAGDIDVGVRGVRWAKQTFTDRPVIYVPGNHEYYRQAIPRLVDKLRVEAEGSTVHVLERDAIELGGVTVLGCTLWTDLALHGDTFVGCASVAEVMTDYRLIRVSPQYRRLRPEDTVALHHRSLRWLQSELASRSGTKLVVTHHAPSPVSLGSESMDGTSAAYASQLEEFVQEHRPSLWIHGHIHRMSDYQIGATRVVCNPRGYSDEPCREFDPGMVVEVTP